MSCGKAPSWSHGNPIADEIFLSLEARAAGCIEEPPARPPMPWNPKHVKAEYVEGRGPAELPPDAPDEWRSSAGLQEIGRRRYSHYTTYANRDGPQLASGLHPSRSSLRPIVSSYVRTKCGGNLECITGEMPQLRVGTAGESLECRVHGPETVMQRDGTVKTAIGHPPPAGRPFSGYRSTVFNASEQLEAHPSWTLENKRMKVRIGDKRGSLGGDETLMDQIVAQFPSGTPPSESSTSRTSD